MIDASCLHIKVVGPPQEEDVIVVDINHIEHKCVFMYFDDMPDVAFVAEFPNAVETD